MKTKEEIPNHFGKIRSIIFGMAQERRIRSNELDDLNQALRELMERIDMLILANESMEEEAKGIGEIKREKASLRYKMEICLELSGMSKAGIKYLMSYPTCFLELALALRVRIGNALETEHDFFWMDNLWICLNLQIETDLESFQQANLTKQIYHRARDPVVRKQTIKIMEAFAEELAYLKTKLGKDVDEKELLNLITNHWYNVYRHNPARAKG